MSITIDTKDNKETTVTQGEQSYPTHNFKNMYGELDYYKKKCDFLDKDLSKSQAQNKKLESIVKQMQEINSTNSKSVNNTSSSFLLPSEFKSIWETLEKDLLLEAFESFFDSYSWLAHLTQDTIKIVYEESNLVINDYLTKMLVILKINNEVTNETFLQRVKFIFQDFFATIFAFNDDFIEKVKIKLKQTIKTYKDFEDKESDFLSDIETKQFKTLIQTLFKLCVYMLLHEPVLTLNIQDYESRSLVYHYYHKNEFINIEGFGNEKSSCAVILSPPVLRKNFYYQGIKPAVYILANADETIKQECEKNKVILAKGRSNSITDPSITSLKVSKKMEVGPNLTSNSPKLGKSCLENDSKNDNIGNKKNKNISDKNIGSICAISFTDKNTDKKVEKKPPSMQKLNINNLSHIKDDIDENVETEKHNDNNNSKTLNKVTEKTNDKFTNINEKLVDKNKDYKELNEKSFEIHVVEKIIVKTPKDNKDIKTIIITNNTNTNKNNQIEKPPAYELPKKNKKQEEDEFNSNKIKNETMKTSEVPFNKIKLISQALDNSTMTQQLLTGQNASKTPRTHSERIETVDDLSNISADTNINEKQGWYTELRTKNIPIPNNSSINNNFPKKPDHKPIHIIDLDNSYINNKSNNNNEKSMITEQLIRKRLNNETTNSPGLYSQLNITNDKNDSYLKNYDRYDQYDKFDKYEKNEKLEKKAETMSKYSPLTLNITNNNNQGERSFHHQHNSSHNNNNSYYLNRKNSHTSELLNDSELKSLNINNNNNNNITNNLTNNNNNKNNLEREKLNFGNINNNISRLTNSHISNTNNSQQKIYSYKKEEDNFNSNYNINSNNINNNTSSTYKTYTQYVKNKNITSEIGIQNHSNHSNNQISQLQNQTNQVNNDYYSTLGGNLQHKRELLSYTPTKINKDNKEDISQKYNYNNNYIAKEEYSNRKDKSFDTKHERNEVIDYNSGEVFNQQKKDSFADRIMRNRDKGKSKEYEYYNNNNNNNNDISSNTNTSSSKITKADIKNKIDKYYMKMSNMNNTHTSIASSPKKNNNTVTNNYETNYKAKEVIHTYKKKR